MDLSKKQYQKMVGNKPAKRRRYDSLATIMAKKMGKKSFIDELEAHKAEARSFDDGTWKPKKKGQSFIDALEAHKADKRFW
jgi:hypothetical protein